jgi:hypothetical protein
MNLPKWDLPTWVNLTPDKIKHMSEVEIRNMLKGALAHVKTMPDSIPCKPYMVELGKMALKINEYAIQLEKGVSDDEADRLRGLMEKTHERAVELMMKIAAMQKDPTKFIQHIVEITESFEEDPWAESYRPEPSVPPFPLPQLNPVNEEYDPWAIANEL